jgi:hypothetical protein
MIDIGTAQGCLPVEIFLVHPHLTGGGFDLPAIEPTFMSYTRKHGLSDRLQFYPGNFFSDPLPEADVHVMGRILHNWDLPTKTMLLANAHQALPVGGALIVYDPLIDDRRRVRAHALLSSLNMLIETAGGFEYTAAHRGRRGLWRCQYCPCRFPLTKRTRVNCCVSSSSRRRLWTLRPGVIPTDLVVCERWTRASTRRVRVRFRQLCDVARCWRGE